jgi:hypothetical protein
MRVIATAAGDERLERPRLDRGQARRGRVVTVRLRGVSGDRDVGRRRRWRSQRCSRGSRSHRQRAAVGLDAQAFVDRKPICAGCVARAGRAASSTTRAPTSRSRAAAACRSAGARRRAARAIDLGAQGAGAALRRARLSSLACAAITPSGCGPRARRRQRAEPASRPP